MTDLGIISEKRNGKKAPQSDHTLRGLMYEEISVS